MQKKDRTLLWMGLGLAAVSLAGPRFYILRPNRLVDGAVLSAWAGTGVLPVLLFAAVLAFLAWAGFVRGLLPTWARVALAALLCAGPFAAASALSNTLGPEDFQGNAAVINPTLSLGMLFYALAAGLFLVLHQAVREALGGRRFSVLLSLALFAAPVAAFWAAGAFGHVSIFIELSRNREAIFSELLRHLTLSLGAAGLGLAISLGLGIAAYRHRGLEHVIFPFINFAQVVPTLSLLALLMIPLAWVSDKFPWLRELGVSGIGFAPAFVVLVLYALLPITANILAALRGTPGDVLESARGMGMGDRQILWRIQLPLAFGAILAGFRTACLQSIGNCILAGLIGGGGLGALIFLGLAQSAPDMVLGASFVVVALAALVDGLLRLLEDRFGSEPGGSHD